MSVQINTSVIAVTYSCIHVFNIYIYDITNLRCYLPKYSELLIIRALNVKCQGEGQRRLPNKK